MNTERQINNEFDFVLVCDGCGPIAGFVSLNAAMGHAQRWAGNVHRKCVPAQKPEVDDGKRITVLNLAARYGYERAGRF